MRLKLISLSLIIFFAIIQNSVLVGDAILTESAPNAPSSIIKQNERIIGLAGKDFDFGVIATKIPAQMLLNETYLINVRIHKNASTLNSLSLAENGMNLGDISRKPIKISTKNYVSLNGENFKITPVTSYVQTLPDEGYSEWKWQVIPSKTGNRSLTITVGSLIDLDGDKLRIVNAVFANNVTVSVEPSGTALFEKKMGDPTLAASLFSFLFIYKLIRKLNLNK